MYGGPEETRTLDLSDANRTLSQLSYRPKYSFRTGERLALHAAYPNIIAHLSENARLFSAWCGTFSCSFVNDVRLEKRERVARLGRRFC